MSFKQDNNPFKQDNNSFKRLITRLNDLLCRSNKLSCFNKMITHLNDLLSVSQLTETSWNVPNGPEVTGTDRNGHTKLPKRTSVGTETDFAVYQNGAECGFSSHRNEYNGYQKRQAR